ncbi:MAG: class I tRNA ligase family protein, partial [Clostridiaceae bacterium]
GMASQKIYDFIWTEYCDYYIEFSKGALYGEDEQTKGVTLNCLNIVLENSLKLLHPIMPFITEEIYCQLDDKNETITTAAWPCFDEKLQDKKSEDTMNLIIESIKSIRNVRAEMNVIPSRKAKLIFNVDAKYKNSFEESSVYFEKLASASSLEFINNKKDAPQNAVSKVISIGEVYIPLFDLIDVEKELERLDKEKIKLISEIDRVDKKLANKRFVEKAPEQVVNEEKAKKVKYQEMLNAVEERIETLK